MVLQSMRSVAKYIWWFLVLAFVGSFLLYETSGLSGRSPVTTTTAVATVNGEEILLTSWQNAVSNLEQQEQQRRQEQQQELLQLVQEQACHKQPKLKPKEQRSEQSESY